MDKAEAVSAICQDGLDKVTKRDHNYTVHLLPYSVNQCLTVVKAPQEFS